MRLGPGVDYRTLAVLDLGSNTFQMLIARVGPGGARVLRRHRVVVRLGAGLSTGRLDDVAQERAFTCLREFRQHIEALQPDAVRAVGTAAFRHLEGDFVQAAGITLGSPIEVVSGQDEARLVHRGVHELLGPTAHRTLIFDIGGGSTECVIGEDQAVHFDTSVPWGAGNLARAWRRHGRFSPEDYLRAREAAITALRAQTAQAAEIPWDHCIGTAGAIKRVHRTALRRGWVDEYLCVDALQALEHAMLHGGEEALIDKDKPGWADALTGGLAMVSAAFRVFGIQTMHPCRGAFRTGLLHETAGALTC